MKRALMEISVDFNYDGDDDDSGVDHDAIGAYEALADSKHPSNKTLVDYSAMFHEKKKT
jgi:hypothetical protein